MTKRRINKQQTRRIQEQHVKRQQRAKQQNEHEDNGQLGPEQPGLLISCFGTQVEVESQDGHLVRCLIRQNLGTLVAGDNVIWRSGVNHQGVVVALCPRHSVLGRPNKQGEIRPIAANIDQMLIVAAPQPALTVTLLDSYLVAAETLKIAPLVVLNKVDLLTPHERKEFLHLQERYIQLGYQFVETSTVEKKGLDNLASLLKNKVSVFVGQSGVGKSSLILALLPKAELAIGEISASTAFGKHTTSNSTLYHLSDGGDIIDSPGVREFSLWQMPANQIARGFKELAPLLSLCKFRDCTHVHEPGCAVLQAKSAGLIHPERLQSYHKLREKWHAG